MDASVFLVFVEGQIEWGDVSWEGSGGEKKKEKERKARKSEEKKKRDG